MATIRVAAVQVRSDNGAPQENLRNAEAYVAKAAADGAELVLCPEFLAAGYIYEETIWDSGEPRGSATESWLAELALRHRITIGATYLEASDDDFFNTFALFGPDGNALGRVRKQSLPFFEGWFFAPCPLPKVIETPLGRVCVGICNDNQTAEFLGHVLDTKPDIILMPHSAPTPQLPTRAGAALTRHFESQLADVAAQFARATGVPVVMANKVADAPFTTSLPIAPRLRIKLLFRGHSSICDADGQTLGHLAGQQGVLVSDIELDQTKFRHPVRPRGYWSFAPKIAARAMGRLLIALDRWGQRSYRTNPRRAQAARRASESPPAGAGGRT